MVHLWQKIDQKLRLRAIVRRITVNTEETQQAIDQVIDGGPYVGLLFALLPPARKAKTVAFILFQRSGVEDADDVITYAHGFDAFSLRSCRLPIKRVNVLQNREHARVFHTIADHPRKMLRRE